MENETFTEQNPVSTEARLLPGRTQKLNGPQIQKDPERSAASRHAVGENLLSPKRLFGFTESYAHLKRFRYISISLND